jgi:hypothetical protein
MSNEKKVLDFKKYLAKDNPLTGKLYFGPFNHDVDEGFESSVKAAEKKIATAIDNQAVIGHLWKTSGFNYDASIEDLHNSLMLISKAQATLGTLDAQMENGQNDIPDVMRFMNAPPGYLEEGDPDQSQRQGVADMNLPGDLASDNMDERVLQIINMMNMA